jgi:hypothetical protein
VSQLAPRPKFEAVKFTDPGATVTGTVAFPPEDLPVTNFDTKAPVLWPDGSPQMQTKVVLNTSEGTFALYAKGRLLSAIRSAVGAAKAPDVEVGGTLTVTYTKDGERRDGRPGFKPKEFEAKYVPPAAGDDDGPPF